MSGMGSNGGDVLKETPELSVVLPFFNEEACLVPVVEELAGVLDRDLTVQWEILLVDDGSTDGTAALADGFAARDARIRVLHLSPRSGQSAALEAGFRRARGIHVAVLDGDGQNDPADIPRLVHALGAKGADMMCGIRVNRADIMIRRASSRIANRVRASVLKDGITDAGCAIRVFRRDCLDRIHFFRNAHRFFPALMIQAGF